MKFKQISTKFLSCATSIAVFTSGLLLNNLNIKAAANQLSARGGQTGCCKYLRGRGGVNRTH